MSELLGEGRGGGGRPRGPGGRGDHVDGERAAAHEPRQHERGEAPDDGEEQRAGAHRGRDHVAGRDRRRRRRTTPAAGCPSAAPNTSVRSSSGSARTTHQAPSAPRARRSVQRGPRRRVGRPRARPSPPRPPLRRTPRRRRTATSPRRSTACGASRRPFHVKRSGPPAPGTRPPGRPGRGTAPRQAAPTRGRPTRSSSAGARASRSTSSAAPGRGTGPNASSPATPAAVASQPTRGQISVSAAATPAATQRGDGGLGRQPGERRHRRAPPWPPARAAARQPATGSAAPPLRRVRADHAALVGDLGQRGSERVEERRPAPRAPPARGGRRGRSPRTARAAGRARWRASGASRVPIRRAVAVGVPARTGMDAGERLVQHDAERVEVGVLVAAARPAACSGAM